MTASKKQSSIRTGQHQFSTARFYKAMLLGMVLSWQHYSMSAAAGPGLQFENMTKIPGSDIGFPSDTWLVFDNNARSSKTATQWHNHNTLRIHSNGTEPLTITNIEQISPNDFGPSPWRIELINGHPVTPATLPLTIPPGKYADVVIRFADDNPACIRIFGCPLVFHSNAGDQQVTLHGGNMVDVEGGNELNVQEIINLFGFKTSTAGVNPTSFLPTTANIRRGEEGDAVWSKYYVQADPAKPVRLIQIAAFKGAGGTTVKLTPPDSDDAFPGCESTFLPDWHQSFYPRNMVNTNAVSGFSVDKIPGQFRINVANYTTSTGNDQGQFVDKICGIRLYKVIDGTDKVIPYNYIVMMDYICDGCGKGNANCDWNDNMFYVSNIRPVAESAICASIPDMTVRADQPFTFGVGESFAPGYLGNRFVYKASLPENTKLPDWLSFDPEFATFSGTPPALPNYRLTISISATDSNGHEVPANDHTTFMLKVLPAATTQTAK